MIPPRPATPYVLFDDARPGGEARLYIDPLAIVEASEPEAVSDALAAVRQGVADGLNAAGFIAYDAAPAIDPAASARAESGPLLWFGLFERYERLTGAALARLLPDARGGWVGAPEPEIAFPAYRERAEALAELIAAGDLYQANLSFRAIVPTAGSPLALYAGLRPRAGAGHGAVIDTGGGDTIVSLSPELFFSLQGGNLTARPMKGTAPRGATREEDAALATRLASDPKERAENLMILDLMRNDLTRIAVPGSVKVPERFAVETYPTVHQMVSEVTARIAPGKDAIDAIGALFPCGSVTGAPKIRAMQVIEEAEPQSARGPYTGAIGRIDASGDAVFSVAIRTLSRQGGNCFRIGLGSGYVADSEPEREWRECLAKGAFLTEGQRNFDLIETMAFDPDRGIALLDRHLARMKASAATFGFAFDRHVARNELQAATFRLVAASRIRLLLSRSGAIAIEIAPMPASPFEPVAVALAPLPVDPEDFRLTHKTSDRAFYDEARHASGAFEVIFTLPDGRISEGSFTNVFVPRGDALATPPATGALAGVLRAELIETGRAVVEPLCRSDLAQEFFIGNSLRGLIRARLASDTVAEKRDAV